MNIVDLYTDLGNYLTEIKAAYLQKYLDNPLATPGEYSLDIKSLCILCHAAFEEFMESVALTVMTESIKKYQNENKISRPLISLMHFIGKHDNYLSDKQNIAITEIQTIFDYTRIKLNDVKKTFSREIIENHGISLKYIRKLLMPVSISIPTNVNWNSSLEKLATERGAYAHKFLKEGRVQESINPETANYIIIDCLAMCDDIKSKALEVLTFY
jgi:hypothetical protein